MCAWLHSLTQHTCAEHRAHASCLSRNRGAYPMVGRAVLCAYLLSPVQLFETPWSVARQAPLSMGVFRQEYWCGLPFLSAGDLPIPGIQPVSPALASRFFTTESLGKPGGGTPPAKNWDYSWKREKESWGSNFYQKRKGENTRVFMAVTS